MKTIRTSILLAALTAAAALLLSACGGSGDSGEDTPAANGSGTAQIVSVDAVDGVGDVLVDSGGAALYAADQEEDGSIVCTQSCTTIWEPLTVSTTSAPSGDAGLSARLDAIRRPDGARQVTFDGRLLYRFALDPAPGVVTGNGLADTFDGRAFTWHVATPTGVSKSDANSSTGSSGYDLSP